MRVAKWMTGSLVSIALLSGSVAAEARPRYGHGGGWDHHHRRDRGDGFGVGDAIGVAALIGAVAIVASSMSKDKKARESQAGDNAPPPRDGTDYGRDVADGQRDDADFSDVALRDEDAMTDACAVAARDEAQGQGGYAEVRRIDAPVATQGGFNIDGEVETRANWRATAGTTRRFTCTVADGRVTEVYLSRDVAAR
jgi:hypothetical protein